MGQDEAIAFLYFQDQWKSQGSKRGRNLGSRRPGLVFKEEAQAEQNDAEIQKRRECKAPPQPAKGWLSQLAMAETST